MEKTEIMRIAAEAVGFILLTWLGTKAFKYKDIIVKVIEAAKDTKVTEAEFQGIIDEVKKEIYQ